MVLSLWPCSESKTRLLAPSISQLKPADRFSWVREQTYHKLLILLHFRCKAETWAVVSWEEILHVVMTRSLTHCKHCEMQATWSHLLVCTVEFNTQKLQLKNTTEPIVYVVIILIPRSCDRELLHFSTGSWSLSCCSPHCSRMWWAAWLLHACLAQKLCCCFADLAQVWRPGVLHCGSPNSALVVTRSQHHPHPRVGNAGGFHSLSQKNEKLKVKSLGKMSNLCFLCLLERHTNPEPGGWVLLSDMGTTSRAPHCEEQSVIDVVKPSSSGIYSEECPVLPWVLHWYICFSRKNWDLMCQRLLTITLNWTWGFPEMQVLH